MGSEEGECWVECPKQIGRKVNLERGVFCEKAFRQNELDQCKAAVLGRMHGVPVLWVLALFKFEQQSTVPVMWCGRWLQEAVWLGRVDAAVQCRSRELGFSFVLSPDINCSSSSFCVFAFICWKLFLRPAA